MLRRLLIRLLVTRWSDGRARFYLFRRGGLALWRWWERAVAWLGRPARSFYAIDYDYRVPERDQKLIDEILADYRLSLERADTEAPRLVPSRHWLELNAAIDTGLDAETLHDFRRRRLAMYGISAGGAILDEAETDVALKLPSSYSIGKNHVFRSAWHAAPARDLGFRVVEAFHRFGPFVDPGLLALADESPVGGPILPVHQGRHLSRNLIGYVYYLTNLIRHTDLSARQPLTVCEIGGGYGGFAKLFKQTFPRARFVIFDLPECLALSAFYLRSNFPGARIGTLRDLELKVVLADDQLRHWDFVLLPWWYAERLGDGSVDLFLNSASMQEMPMEFVRYYADAIQRAGRGYFYWINRWRAPERYGGVSIVDYPFDQHWRTVFTRSAEESPLGLHEWLGARTWARSIGDELA